MRPVQSVTSRTSDSGIEVSASLLSVDQNAASAAAPRDALQPSTWQSPADQHVTLLTTAVTPTRHITDHCRHTNTSHYWPLPSHQHVTLLTTEVTPTRHTTDHCRHTNTSHYWPLHVTPTRHTTDHCRHTNTSHYWPLPSHQHVTLLTTAVTPTRHITDHCTSHRHVTLLTTAVTPTRHITDHCTSHQHVTLTESWWPNQLSNPQETQLIE